LLYIDSFVGYETHYHATLYPFMETP